ncbi:class I SAM-dependent methyltransferase [uncultured Microscilla sp.]|uniref:class I SAM-dependent DNA methyltransferase n=1 Tax=uncultured Microscilla sp. TaxID=432653 RepID=UPI002629A699|nr:class I SAM-dependent methyltransferase [uncultured Microscilla sp.]
MEQQNNEIKDAYNDWAAQYDTNHNHTRDMEGIAMRCTLKDITFNDCLELGCGTGKNTAWLLTQAQHLTAVDLSERMLEKAQEKVQSEKVNFVQADITQGWSFVKRPCDLITFSLLLEHIEDISAIFSKAVHVLKPGGYIYIGELHSIKQYMGSKARYETPEGTKELICFTHHTSDFFKLAKLHQLDIVEFEEHFDNDDRKNIPRILTFLLQKK